MSYAVPIDCSFTIYSTTIQKFTIWKILKSRPFNFYFNFLFLPLIIYLKDIISVLRQKTDISLNSWFYLFSVWVNKILLNSFQQHHPAHTNVNRWNSWSAYSFLLCAELETTPDLIRYLWIFLLDEIFLIKSCFKKPVK